MSDQPSSYQSFKTALTKAVNECTGWCWLIASLAIAIIVMASAAKATGYPIKWLPSLDPTPLAYLCGAYWLARK